jgi:hypothetical protein
MAFDMNPRDDERDEEEEFVLAIAGMIQDSQVSLAKIHTRAYIDHLVAEREAKLIADTRLKMLETCIDVAVSCRAEDVAQRLRALVDDDRSWVAGQMSDEIESLAAECHRVYTIELRRQGVENRHPDNYEKMLEPIKDIDRAIARFILERDSCVIAATLRTAADKIDEIIPAEFLRGHQCGDGPRSEIVTKYTRRAVLSILPTEIAAHAEERDRRAK